jgi:hypothetical protein
MKGGGRTRLVKTMGITQLKEQLSKWSLILLCFFMAVALGGGFYEHIILVPLWSASPPASFTVIQPGTGVPLQTFWIPVHAGITVFVLSSVFLTWKDIKVRRLLLVGLASYIIMRVWSGLFFIREMLEFQRVSVTSAPSPELSARVASWIYWSWFREALDIISFLCFLLALFWLNRTDARVAVGPAR